MTNRSDFHYRVEGKPVHGFAAESAVAGAQVKVFVKGFVHSDQQAFHKFMNQLSSVFVQNRFRREEINTLLIQMHRDSSADVHVNDINLIINMKVKRDVAKGEYAGLQDVSDIAEVRFANVAIAREDGIAFCFRCGWKYGLFFDFSPLHGDGELDPDELASSLGKHLKYILFQELYEVIQDNKTFSGLFEDGWFPFIALIGGDYEHLAEIYDGPNRDALVSAFVDKFDQKKLYCLTDLWWRKPLLRDKKEILLAGVDAYLTQNIPGYITCIKTLYSEIEGILRLAYFKDNNCQPTFAQLKAYARDRAQHKFISEDPLSFPDFFYRYLDEILFRDFNLQTGEIALSRHSASHGVAPTREYTREKGLQAILTVDQMSRLMD